MKLALRRFSHSQSGRQQWKATAPQHTASADAKETLLAWLERAARAFMQRLVVDAEPRVWYTCDGEGNLWWHAYDPITGRSLYDVSEAEIRVWIEQRHYPALAD
jgi:hypothetical protein